MNGRTLSDRAEGLTRNYNHRWTLKSGMQQILKTHNLNFEVAVVKQI